jgi:hypothetical protein
MKKYIIILTAIIFFFGCSKYTIIKKESIVENPDNHYLCSHWKKDSIGEYSKRMIIYQHFKFYKPLVGQDWSSYSDCFGKPNYVNDSHSITTYYYRYTNYKNSIDNLYGDAFIIFTVDNRTLKITQVNTRFWE